MSDDELKDDHDDHYIIDCIFKSATIFSTILDISPWCLDGYDYEILFQKLSTNKQIKKLQIRCKILPHELFKPLSLFLIDHTTILDTLDLQCSIFKGDNFESFCESMQTNVTIKELDLSGCIIEKQHESINHLHNMLIVNKTLEILRLHRVFLYDTSRKTVQKACDMIAQTSVRYLDITTNFCGNMPYSVESSEHTQQIINALRYNRYIKNFKLMEYMISPTVLDLLIDILEKDNYTLTYLFVGINVDNFQQNRYFISKKDKISMMLHRNACNQNKRDCTLFNTSYDYFIRHLNKDPFEKLDKRIKRMRIR